MKIGTLEELRDRLGWYVDFNPTQTDQDFRGPSSYANKRIDNELNLAYREEVNEGKMKRESAFKRKHSFTWTANASTLTIPEPLQGRRILWLRDNTDVNPGPIITIWDETSDGRGFYVIDDDTWGWSPAPSSARTLQAAFLADAVWMSDESDVPSLVPVRHRELIALTAAIRMHMVAPVTDTTTFQYWKAQQVQLRFAWWKELSRGSPSEYPSAHIRNNYPDMNEQH